MRKTNITKALLQRSSIRNQPKTSIAEKRRNQTENLNGNSIRCLITQGRKSGIINIDANIRHLKKVINVEQGKKDQEWSLQEHQNIDWSLLSVKISPSEKKMTTCQTKC